MSADAPIPMLPVLGARRGTGRSAARPAGGAVPGEAHPPRIHALTDAMAAVRYPSGRSAIGAALARIGTAPGDRVLVPAYHCPSMIAPLAWHGAVPVWYRLDQAFGPDLDHLAGALAGGARAVIAAHLFGRPLALETVRSLCERYGAALIEDCAHTLFYTADAPRPGQHGDFAITSIRKFYPVRDGGQLLSSSGRHITSPTPQTTALRDELKIAWNTLEDAVGHGELRWLQPLVGAAGRLRRRPAAASPAARAERGPSTGTAASASTTSDLPAGHREITAAADSGDRRFDAASSGRAMSQVSRMIVAATSRTEIARRRRANFLFLARALADSDAGRVLVPALDGVAVPYVLLFELRDPALYDTLVRERFPVWRWDRLLVSGVCPVTDHWRYRLVQLPVHQGLSREQLLRLAHRLGGSAP